MVWLVLSVELADRERQSLVRAKGDEAALVRQVQAAFRLIHIRAMSARKTGSG